MMYHHYRSWCLDILPIAAATVGVESLFSCGKEVVTDRRSRLSPTVFEQVQCLEHNWKPKLVDLARENDSIIEEIYMQDFEAFEKEDELLSQLDTEDTDSDSDDW